VAILECLRCFTPLDGCPDHCGDVLPLLLCRGGQARDAGAHPPVRRGGVTDREYAGAAGDSKIAVDDDATGLFPGVPEPLRRR
jgi:hypothetical protein